MPASSFLKSETSSKISKSCCLAIEDLHNRNFPKSKWGRTHLEKYFSDQSRHPICIKIENKNKIIGFALGRLSKEKKSEISLCTLLVSRRYRRKGCGEKLMQGFFQAALKVPAMKKIVVHFRHSNREVENFYVRFGFSNHMIDGKYSNGEEKHYLNINRKAIEEYLLNQGIQL